MFTSYSIADVSGYIHKLTNPHNLSTMLEILLFLLGYEQKYTLSLHRQKVLDT